ncbi:MAG: hypothetical protein RIR51_1944, partial [Bacteroidota bacterium]
MDNNSIKIESDFQILLKFVLKEWMIFLKIFKKKYLLFFVGSLIFSGGIGSYIYFTPGKFISNTRFFLNSDPLSTGNNFNSISAVTNLLGIGDALNTVSERSRQTFFSESLIKNVLFNEVVIGGKKDLIINHFIELENLREEWESSSIEMISRVSDFKIKPENKNYQNRDASLQIRLVLNEILNPKKLFYGVSLDPKSGIITIQVRHENEEFCLNFNEILNQEFINFNYSIIQNLGQKNELFVRNKV